MPGEQGTTGIHRHSAREKGPSELSGQPRREVPSVGGGGQHDNGGMLDVRCDGSRPLARTKLLAELEHPQLRGSVVAAIGTPRLSQASRGIGRSRPYDERDAMGLGYHLLGAYRQPPAAHRHDRDHSREPSRSPSITAACARLGATQSPTRRT